MHCLCRWMLDFQAQARRSSMLSACLPRPTAGAAGSSQGPAAPATATQAPTTASTVAGHQGGAACLKRAQAR